MDGELLKFDERWQHQIEESEILKEQLSLCQDQNDHLSQVVSGSYCCSEDVILCP